MQKLQGWVEQGNTVVAVGGLTSTTKIQKSFPSATVTVYVHDPAPLSLTSISRTANVVTAVLAAGHGFIAGRSVVIAGVTDNSFNGTFVILTVGSVNFTYAQVAANGSSTGGTADSDRLASLYSDDAAVPTPLANPFVANSDGTWGFYAANGRYDVTFSGTVTTPHTISDIQAGVGGSGIPSYALAQLPTSNSQNAGNVARVTDSSRGLWMDTGTQWSSLSGRVYDVTLFGAVGDGVTDDSAAINAAAAAGGTVFFPPLTYLVASEIAVTVDYTHLYGPGATLKAATVNQNIVHWSAKRGRLDGLILDGNNIAGTTGLRISPISEAGTTVYTVTSFNAFYFPIIQNCAEGIVLRSGPKVGGFQSDCSYNEFYSPRIVDCIRNVWLIPHPTDATAGAPDTNHWYSLFIGSTGVRTNTGIQIDAGGTNGFYGCSTIGVANGITPNATPTAIYIAGSNAVTGVDNNSNFFFGQRSENDTRCLNITTANAHYTSFLASSGFTTAKIVDNGTGTVILSSPYNDKNGLWYTYSDATGIPVIAAASGFGVQVGAADATHRSLYIKDTTRPYASELGSFGIINSVDPTKALIMGIDTTLGANGSGYITAVKVGVTAIPLLLNPEGGPVGIGCTTPTSGLQVHFGSNYIPVYANNAAAVAGGLTQGAIYRTGADPDALMMVH